MPLYEYHCLTCGHTFDAIQKFSDAPLSDCPECGERVEKCMSAPAIQFKGSGFYITDYAKKGKGPGKVAEKPGKKKSGSGDTTAKKTDPKPKSDAKPKT